MKSQMVTCALLSLALGVASALADDIKPVEGVTTPDKDTTIASKIIGNGRAPDGSECKDAATDCEAPATNAIAGEATPVRPASAIETASQAK